MLRGPAVAGGALRGDYSRGNVDHVEPIPLVVSIFGQKYALVKLDYDVLFKTVNVCTGTLRHDGSSFCG